MKFSDLRVGQRVLDKTDYDPQTSRGTVVYCEDHDVGVEWDGCDFTHTYSNYAVVFPNWQIICRHCNMPLEDHADGEKCLYGPTYYKC